MYKHKKPASQFILYVPIDPIGPHLVLLIRNSEFHLQTNFWANLVIRHIVMDVKICEKCRILRVWLQKASDIQYESTKPASKRTTLAYLNGISKEIHLTFYQKVPCKIKTPFRRFQHHSAVIKWFKICYFHKLKFHRIWTCWINSWSITVSGYSDCQD